MTFKYRKQKKNMPPWYNRILRTYNFNINYSIKFIMHILFILLTINSSFTLASPCDSNSWWNSIKDKCIPCTKCNTVDNLIVLKPCQLHQDTICGKINDLEIDWFLLTRTEPNWKDRRKDNFHLISESLSSTQDNNNLSTNNNIIKNNNNNNSTYEHEFEWDTQSVSFILATIACLLFFLAIGYIFIEHMRQWRRMERRLDKDVEELSAKLMAKLAEVQNVENGSFIIDNPVKNARPVEVHCVRMEKCKDIKSPVLNSLTQHQQYQHPRKWIGNVYIEENNCNFKY